MRGANVKPLGGGRSHNPRFSNRMLDTTVAFVKAAEGQAGAKRVAA
jgi:hypothetical protein